MSGGRLLVAVLCLGLAGCFGDKNENLRQWMADQAKGLRGKVQPLPEIKPFDTVAYEAGNLVDPFRNSRIEPERRPTGGGLRPNFDRRKEPLEAFPLESLKMVGTLQQGSLMQGIVKADATIYRVRTGNYMGQNFGVITQINDNEIVLKELVQDPNGDWVERNSSLQLQEQESKK
ncbi:MAG: pilus assembly protein PilP [Rhodocyclaceae bacterium]|nr:pilus assembly protein PilP [Rhodocyclaceae bacterium]MBX3670402.1 pilus assembly protein PilP [Rhodocyclaceae bacterium]